MHRTSCDQHSLFFPATVMPAYVCSRFWILVSDSFLILSFSLTSLNQSCCNHRRPAAACGVKMLLLAVVYLLGSSRDEGNSMHSHSVSHKW